MSKLAKLSLCIILMAVASISLADFDIFICSDQYNHAKTFYKHGKSFPGWVYNHAFVIDGAGTCDCAAIKNNPTTHRIETTYAGVNQAQNGPKYLWHHVYACPAGGGDGSGGALCYYKMARGKSSEIEGPFSIVALIKTCTL